MGTFEMVMISILTVTLILFLIAGYIAIKSLKELETSKKQRHNTTFSGDVKAKVEYKEWKIPEQRFTYTLTDVERTDPFTGEKF